MPALWTAVDRALPVVFVVVNNRAYGAVRAALRRFDGDGRRPRALPGDANWRARTSRRWRAGSAPLGIAVARLDELDARARARASGGGPAVVEVLTDPNDSGPIR